MKHFHFLAALTALSLTLSCAATFAQVPGNNRSMRFSPREMMAQQDPRHNSHWKFQGELSSPQFPQAGNLADEASSPGSFGTMTPAFSRTWNVSSMTIPPILDKTFGTNGTVRNAIAGAASSRDKACSVAIQSDGKILSAGYSEDVSWHYAFALSRYNPDGTLDNTFGTSGTVRNAINGGDGKSDAANSVALQSDGKIVAAGNSAVYVGNNDHYHFALARYNSDGTLDNTFGTNGTVRDSINGGNGTGDGAKSVVIQSDGKIVAAGNSQDASGHYAFALARYNSDGTLDNTFGTNGTVRSAINGGNGSYDLASSVVIQADGKIVASGYSRDASGHYAFAVARYNSNGSLDNTFGTGGTVRNAINGGNGSFDVAYSVALQSDGKIVSSGGSKDASGHYAFAVARYNSDGTLDNTFGTGGSARCAINGGSGIMDFAYSVAMQSDGKIVSAGFTEDADEYDSLALARFNPDGSLDNTFGTNGTIKTVYNGGNGTADDGYSVVIQSDAKIVVAGCSWDASGGAFAVARLNPNGTFDNSFGTGGSVRNTINGGSSSLDGAYSVAMQPDGKIVAAGYSKSNLTLYSFALARYNTDGTPDNTFGTKGTVKTAINGLSPDYAGAHSVAIQSDGKIVAAGGSWGSSGNCFALARYNADGTLDNTFGSGGIVKNAISGGDSSNDVAYSVAIQSDGKIVAAGYSKDHASSNYSFALARYNLDGTLDNTFGTNGTVRNAISGTNHVDFAYSIAIQADGKIVAGGYSNNEFALARYNSSGSLDNTFGTNGTVRSWISGGSGSYDYAYSIAVQSDGKIVAAGSSNGASGNNFALARYNSDGTLDNTFGTDGTVRNPISGGNGSQDQAYSVALQSDGKIVAVGRSKDASGNYSFAVARYNPDGTPDNTFGANGTVRHAIGGGGGNNDDGYSVAIQSDGKIVAAGSSYGTSGNNFALARYLVYPYSAPALVSPISNATNQPTTLTLKVNSVDGVSGYHWQVSTNSSFSTTVTNDSTSGAGDTTHTVTLAASTKYYWRVQAFNIGASEFSAPDSFTTMAVASVPKLLFPAHNAQSVRGDTLVFKWNSSATAVKYLFQLSKSAAFSSYAVSDSNVTDTTRKVIGLDNQTKYFWRVSACNVGGASAFAGPDSFTTMVAVPMAPVVVTPAGTTGEPRRTMFKWNCCTNATRYHLQIANDNSVDSIGGFLKANIVFDTTMADTAKKLSTPLSAKTKYYWHVSGIDTAGEGAYSTVEEFTTGTGVDVIDEHGGIPKTYALYQNYPNPFNPSTTIRFDLKEASAVTLEIYSVLGQRVLEKNYGNINAGRYDETIDMTRFASGMYLYRIEIVGLNGDRFVAIRRMLELK